MLLTKLLRITQEALSRSSSFLGSVKELVDFSKDLIREHLEGDSLSPENQKENLSKHELDRESFNNKKNVKNKMDTNFIQSKEESLSTSQGIADHSGSAHHAPGKPGERTNSNMWQRNFENHQGN